MVDELTKLILTLQYNNSKITNANILLKRLDVEDEQDYVGVIDSEENYVINDLVKNGSYDINITYTDEDNDESFTMNLHQTHILNDSTINYLTINLDECGNMLLVDKSCKYFLHEPYMTPNNFDLYFNYASIPSNIITESPSDLRRRLQRCLPLTKILHLNMEKGNFKGDNTINLNTNLKLKYTTYETPTETVLKITGQWNDLDETQTGNVTCKISYLDGNSYVSGATVRLINVHYPLLQYSKTTNDNGDCTFEDLPYGSYVVQILITGYNIPLQLLEVNNTEIQSKFVIGDSEEIEDDESDVQLNVYHRGELILSFGSYDHGEFDIADSEGEYDKGVLTLQVSEDYEDDTSILLNSTGIEEINDFTEVTVNIMGDNNKFVETIPLNFANNYTGMSKVLPLYDGDNKINYKVISSQEDFDVRFEYSDLINYTDKQLNLF